MPMTSDTIVNKETLFSKRFDDYLENEIKSDKIRNAEMF